MLRCAEVVRSRGHEVQALVTRNAAAQRWAADNGIAVLARHAYAAELARGQTDVLVSVTYPALIPAELLATARCAAVNFHDGPLPRYAGMNGASWALLNGETRHAAVWHRLNEVLDGGDILEWSDVEIGPAETSVSLNLRIAAVALEAFHRVIDRVECGDVQGRPQDPSVARTEYSRHDRPARLGAIDWSQPAVQIDRLIRACDFGQYANPFGLAKLVHRGRAVAVLEADGLAGPAGAPGRVVSSDASGLLVETGDGVLRAHRFASLWGRPLNAPQVAEILDLKPGDRLALPGDAADAASLPALSVALSRAEPSQTALLAERYVPQLPFESAGGNDIHEARVPLPPAWRRGARHAWQDASIAAFAVMLSNLLRDDRFDLAWVAGAPGTGAGMAAAVLSPARLWRFQVPPQASFADWSASVSAQREALAASPGFLADLVARHPSLRQQADLQRGEISRVAILAPGAAWPPGAELGLVLDADGVLLASPGALDADTVRQLGRRLTNVMRSAAAQPDQLLARIDTLDDAERDRQLTAWNDTARPFAEQLRIHDLFEQQVRQRPDAVALRCDGQSLSYAELDRAANRVAHALHDKGCGVGQYVALVVERGLDLVVAMLGVAKSGAAYVPIDTIYPQDRLHFMVEDAGCTAIVASASLVERCPPEVPCLCVDGPEVAAASDAPLPCAAGPQDVCYAIYTSGSTGKPKGVVLTHRAVVNTLEWVNREFAVGPHDLLLFVTSPSFDLSVYDVFGALGAGATVEVATPALLGDPAALVRRLTGPGPEGPGITIWDSAPPALARLVSEFPEQAPESRLRLVMLSGDWIPLGLPTRLMGCFPGVAVKSLGGATEAAIWSNHFSVERVEAHWKSIPYGRPIQNARYDILDQHLRPLPAGLAGDLYIGGTCLAQGYLNRPELSAERFIADPHRPGERLYKTGDLARFWADGTMEFLGRADFQVKIRGYRVELGEIESALCKLAGVQAALCTAFADASGQKSLLAYVQTAEPRAFDAAAAKTALGKELPAFMVPAHIVPLRSFPLSSNGKVDRRALPSPAEAARGQAVVAPRTELQRRLVEVWEAVLARSPIGITDNFFDVGGHSLLAVVMAQRMQQAIGQPVPLGHLVSYPTIEALATRLERADTPAVAGAPAAHDVDLAVLCASGQRPLFFICHGQGHAWPYIELANRLGTQYQTYAVMPRALPDIALAHDSIEDMARHCIDAMRRIQPKGPYHIAGLCAGALVGFEMAVQLEARQEDVTLFMLESFVPRVPMRPEAALAAKRRARMQAVRHDDERGWLGTLYGAADKALGALAFEVRKRIEAKELSARLALMRRVLARGGRWPARIKPPGLYEIFIDARDRYWPTTLQRSRVFLIKGDRAQYEDPRDIPVAQLYIGEDLGWEPYVATGLVIHDIASGHLSMLDPPFVDELADGIKQLAIYPPAPAPGPAGATTQKHAGAPEPAASAVTGRAPARAPEGPEPLAHAGPPPTA